MAKVQKNKSQPGPPGNGRRYWSIMLVGEKGRVIPVRRFKEIVMAVVGVTLISLAAMVVLGFLYLRQGRTLDRLQNEVDRLQQKAELLKDEKDILQAKLVMKALQNNAGTAPNSVKKENSSGGDSHETSARTENQTPRETESEPKAPSPPAVHWQADLKQFEISHDPKEELLAAQFRIYNTSKPKKTLSGRIVMVYKSNRDPSVSWLAVPAVPLADGKPSGLTGHAFSVNNYRTIELKAARQRAPEFDMATIFVFRSDGELLLSDDFKIHLPTKKLPQTESAAPAGKSSEAQAKGEARPRPAAIENPPVEGQGEALPQARGDNAKQNPGNVPLEPSSSIPQGQTLPVTDAPAPATGASGVPNEPTAAKGPVENVQSQAKENGSEK